MYKYIIAIIAMLCCNTMYAQQTFTATIKDEHTGKRIEGVTAVLTPGDKKSISDKNGTVKFDNLSNGKYVLILTHTGMEEVEYAFEINNNNVTAEIDMEEAEEELDDVIVQTTRSSRSIKNTPTRVEIINDEELAEKNNMRPANVMMLLHESTGMRVQQTSATSGNANIRMQGLDGRYTQLLKDGYPNFGNFASGLSILEIPPIDLKQVEVIKGPASTLYGGGAIAGVINFISKTPTEEGDYNLLLNQSNIGQSNIGVYASQKLNKFGFAVTGLVNFQKAYDADDDHFSELPKNEDFTINPRLFFYPSERTTFMIGNSFTKGKRTGGDMNVIKGNADANHTYFERNETIRNITTARFETQLRDNSKIVLKQSVSLFNRKLNIPAYNFKGNNTNTFSEASYSKDFGKYSFIAGGNYIFDEFVQQNIASKNLDAKTNTAGLYIQDTWDATDNLVIEAGLRTDAARFKNNNYTYNKTFVLPRVSALFRINEKLSSRVSGGLGYKMPTTFTEETETLQYQNVNALNNVSAEKSTGFTADINYKTNLSEGLQMSINHMFFYTRINNPVILENVIGSGYHFTNVSTPINTNGFETNLRFIYKEHLKLFAGYTFTNARADFLGANNYVRLMPRNMVNLVMMYEKHGNFKLGLEGYFTDRQYLSNLTRTSSFWEFGFMAEKTFGKFSFYINLENFTDVRQSNYKNVVNGTHTNPNFDEIWNHVEGFVYNGGIKIKL